MNTEKQTVKQSGLRQKFWIYFKMGLKKIICTTKYKAFILLYILSVCLLYPVLNQRSTGYEAVDMALKPVYSFGFIIASIIGIILLTILIGFPIQSVWISPNMRRIGLINDTGETPVLLSYSTDIKNKRFHTLTFDNWGIPLNYWEDSKSSIEASLNCTIVEIREGKNKRMIIITLLDGSCQLPDILPWNPLQMSKLDFELILGQSLMGNVSVDLNQIPHILIGGSTGSGKSVLLKLLLMQCIHKNAKVYIADFKGGVDFIESWNKKCTLIFDPENLLDILTEITGELENRKIIFRAQGVNKLSTYNKNSLKQYSRIIFACDEIAELLDKTGKSKEEKAMIDSIISKLSIIARQGRAFGINLLLATQRPDANILPGQIKNNIDCRVCGRADNVLSQIILDNTSAADEIPKSSQGRFIMQDGTVFQSYFFDDKYI